MHTDRIDFISSYCDRWCERCAFTERCVVHACSVAAAMCDGDLEAGMELAVGRPQAVNGERDQTVGEQLLEQIREPSAAELADSMREEELRRASVDELAVSQRAGGDSVKALEWLKGRESPSHADQLIREALEIVAWDSTLISAKLHRALRGRERSPDEASIDDDPTRSDANGSAKVALISLARSETSWLLIADATGDAAAADLASLAAGLRASVIEEFPMAMAFVRPGFDEPGR